MDYAYGALALFNPALAGLVGALVAAPFYREALGSLGQWVRYGVSGALYAHYLSGLASAYVGIGGPHSLLGVGFLLGAFGRAATAMVIRSITATDLWAALRQLLGRR